jgi:hypothetical protein
LSTKGGITSYESPVTLSNCRLQDIHAETAVHIVHSEFELLATQFEDTAANAVDADVSQGSVEQCTFRRVRGNGLDLLGSTTEIRDAQFERVYGAGISAGPASAVTASDIRGTDVHVPVVSRDYSYAQVQGMQIARAWTAGFAAYRDALESGTASIQASGVVFQDDSVRSLVQEESSVSVNDRTLYPGELDVATLRDRQETLAAMRALDYQFSSEIELIGYELETPTVRPGQALTLTLYWSALSPPSRDYTVFTHIQDSAGQTAVGWDNMPCLDRCPTTGWRVGRLVDDIHVIPLPAELPAGEYAVALGVYTLETGERLAVRGPKGQPVPNASVVLDRSIRVSEK